MVCGFEALLCLIVVCRVVFVYTFRNCNVHMYCFVVVVDVVPCLFLDIVYSYGGCVCRLLCVCLGCLCSRLFCVEEAFVCDMYVVLCLCVLFVFVYDMCVSLCIVLLDVLYVICGCVLCVCVCVCFVYVRCVRCVRFVFCTCVRILGVVCSVCWLCIWIRSCCLRICRCLAFMF